MNKKLAFVGSHGVGKTTAAYKLAAKLKHLNFTCEIVHEAARNCPFSINQDAQEETHLWILAKQIQTELEASQKTDLVICDRSVLDTMAYHERVLETLSYPTLTGLNEFVWSFMPTYDYLVYIRPDDSTPLVDDGVRDIDRDFQLDIHRRMLEYFSSETFSKLKSRHGTQLLFYDTQQVFDERDSMINTLYEQLTKSEFLKVNAFYP